MELLLFSEAPGPDFSKIFEEFFGTPVKGLKLAYIPNARDLTIPEKRENATENKETIEALGFVVEEIDLLKIGGKNLLDKLKNKDVIWMNGGYVSNLIKAINTSALRDYLYELLDVGLKYVGSSAGSMVAGKNLDSAVWYPGENDQAAKNLTGLGLVDFQIIPHYNNEFVSDIEKNAVKGEKYYLLTDEQAIGIRDDEFIFFGGKPNVYPKS